MVGLLARWVSAGLFHSIPAGVGWWEYRGNLAGHDGVCSVMRWVSVAACWLCQWCGCRERSRRRRRRRRCLRFLRASASYVVRWFEVRDSGYRTLHRSMRFDGRLSGDR